MLLKNGPNRTTTEIDSLLCHREVDKNKSTERAKSIVQLTIGAFFPAMSLCEYNISTRTEGYRWTKILCLNKIPILRNGGELIHAGTPSRKHTLLQSPPNTKKVWKRQNCYNIRIMGFNPMPRKIMRHNSIMHHNLPRHKQRKTVNIIFSNGDLH